jgi:hypothetical protein
MAAGRSLLLRGLVSGWPPQLPLSSAFSAADPRLPNRPGRKLHQGELHWLPGGPTLTGLQAWQLRLCLAAASGIYAALAAAHGGGSRPPHSLLVCPPGRHAPHAPSPPCDTPHCPLRLAAPAQAAFEGSTHYALEGRWLAMQLREHFPWIKIGAQPLPGARGRSPKPSVWLLPRCPARPAPAWPCDLQQPARLSHCRLSLELPLLAEPSSGCVQSCAHAAMRACKRSHLLSSTASSAALTMHRRPSMHWCSDVSLLFVCPPLSYAVISMREPISQAISMLNHQLDHKRV